MKNIRKQKATRISQGDIYKDVDFIEYAMESAGIIEISKIAFPFVIVLTQDCDLSGDDRVPNEKSQDKKLFSVIVAPLYKVDDVYKGEHLSELDLKMAKIDGDTSRKKLKQNQTPRYHYLTFPDDVPIVSSVIDFKHYFTVNVEYLRRHRRANFICQIRPLFREDVSQRFSNYLSRIGLPE